MRPKANPRYKPMRSSNRRQGTISGHRHSWLQVDKRTLILYAGPSGYADELPDGVRQADDYRSEVPNLDEDRISLWFEHSQGVPFRLPLTDFTEPELQAMRSFIIEAFDKAIPVARVRDRIAEEMYEEHGDDSDTRLYRALPRLSYRKRPRNEHDQGVRERSEESTELAQFKLPAAPVPPRLDRDVAERNQDGGGSQDDGSQAGEREGIREVGGDGGDPF